MGIPQPPDSAATALDRYMCFAAKQSKGEPKLTRGLQVTLSGEFGSRTYTAKRPTTLCVTTAPTGIGPKHAHVQLLCYQVKALKGTPPFTPRLQLGVADEFGTSILDARTEAQLCLPGIIMPAS